jgi:ketosteroid isomerase-like protein
MPVAFTEASMAYIRSYPTITKFDITTAETGGHGDVGFDRGDFTLAAKLPDGTEINDPGSFMSVFRRQSDGSWKHSRVMWHSNLPMLTVPPATKAPATKAR